MILLVWLLFYTTLLAADQTTALAAYHAQDYARALQLLSAVPAEQKSSYSWYVMGQCACNLGQHIDAVVYLKRAQKHGSASLVALCNEQLTRMQADISIQDKTATRNPILHRLWQKTLQPAPILLIQLLFFCAISVLLFFVRALVRKKQYKTLALAVITGSYLGCMLFYCAKEHTEIKALVTSSPATVYASTNSDYHTIAALPAGTLVTVINEKKDWIKICWQSHQGWIQKNTIAVI